MRIRVFANIGIHPIYETLVLSKPDNIVFLNIDEKEFKKYLNELTIYTSKKYKLLKKFYIKVQRIFKYLRYFRVPRSFEKRIDLVYSSRGFVPITKKPFIIDIEHPASFVSMQHEILFDSFVKYQIKKVIEKAKFVLPHCYASLKALVNYLGRDFVKKNREKFLVLYPSYYPLTDKPKSIKREDEIVLFFNGRRFVWKGGVEVLTAFLKLREKYDVKLIMRTKVPEKVVKKYSKYDIYFITRNLPRKDLLKLYLKSHIFVFPSYVDTFGFVLIEAMASGLPIVTSNCFAISEIVRDYINGLIIDTSKYNWHDSKGFWIGKVHRDLVFSRKPEVVNQLIEKISMLIEDSRLYRTISKMNLLDIEKGRFSIEKRNKILMKVFALALENCERCYLK